MRGTLTLVDDTSFLFDGMRMPKDSGLSLPEGATPGSEVQLTFTVNESGRLVLDSVELAQ
jgi:hypothetical protein